MDWKHLLARFDPHWEVLLGHLITFRFAFPSEKDQVPGWVMRELIARLEAAESAPAPGGKICRGTLLSRTQYLYELHEGYADARDLESNGWHGGRETPQAYPPPQQ
jgi:hypothetical protein